MGKGPMYKSTMVQEKKIIGLLVEAANSNPP